MYKFQSQSTLYSCMNVKELMVQTGIKSEVEVTATGFEPTITVCKRTLSHLAKQAK